MDKQVSLHKVLRIAKLPNARVRFELDVRMNLVNSQVIHALTIRPIVLHDGFVYTVRSNLSHDHEGAPVWKPVAIRSQDHSVRLEFLNSIRHNAKKQFSLEELILGEGLQGHPTIMELCIEEALTDFDGLRIH